MKKICILLTLFTLSLLCSCTRYTYKYMPPHERDPKWWGDTYGPEELIDGFRVCLRTDGYYQIIGTTPEVVKDGILIIPQYINNIPVMGYGIPNGNISSKLYINIFKKHISIDLETKGNCFVQKVNIDDETLFEGLENAKKVYINCHHANGCLSADSMYSGIYWEFDNVKTLMNYSADNLCEFSNYGDFFKKGSINPILCFSYGDFLKFQALIEQYMLEYNLNDDTNFITSIIANIEFHYNLYIDDKEYHSFTHPENDLYWIDHLEDGEKLMEPPVPYVEGYTFLGWYKDKECTIPFNFETEAVHEVENEYVWLNLYAKWKYKEK